jgi:hypothetical protein
MLKHSRIPLLFLFIGSLLGVFLRWQFISPTSGANYSFFLHGHSHIMFLGWVFNALYIALVTNHTGHNQQRFYVILFYVLQALTVGMLISFPMQGYGFWSILFSSFHTIGAFVFIIRFLIQTSGLQTSSIWYARTAMIFFMISAAGPFSLAYLMANDLGSSNWYNFSIYFYLHFQYNGFFFFGILALFFNELERKQIRFSNSQARRTGLVFAIACIPAYLLSILWAKPGYTFNTIGSLSAILQCIGLFLFLKLLIENSKEIRKTFKPMSLALLSFALIAVVLKFALQVASAFPSIVQMAYELRPVVIAYLHLVLVGTITSFLFAWYVENELLTKNLIKPAAILFFISFVGMEIVLTLVPWWDLVNDLLKLNAVEYSFGFAVSLSLSYFIFLLGSFKKLTKISR